MKSLQEYLNESFKWTEKDSTIMSDILNVLVDSNANPSIMKYCPSMRNFTNFMDDNEKSLLPSLIDKFSKAGKIQLTKDEKNLVQRIAVFVYKNAYTLNVDISNLYHNVLNI